MCLHISFLSLSLTHPHTTNIHSTYVTQFCYFIHSSDAICALCVRKKKKKKFHKNVFLKLIFRESEWERNWKVCHHHLSQHVKSICKKEFCKTFFCKFSSFSFFSDGSATFRLLISISLALSSLDFVCVCMWQEWDKCWKV